MPARVLMRRTFTSSVVQAVVLFWVGYGGYAGTAMANDPLPRPTIVPPFQTVDLNVGESCVVTLSEGRQVTVSASGLTEQRDTVRGAMRRADLDVQVGGEKQRLVSANYRLPVAIGGVWVDCPVTKGYVENASKTTGGRDPWGLDKEVRLRIWPTNGPWINPGTFRYPARQRWFASATQMANEPVYVDGGDRPGKNPIYYHYGLDIGGAEGLVDVITATDGLVVSVGKATLPDYQDTPVAPRYDVVYVLDDRGWFYRYSHLHTIAAELKPGVRVRQGQPIGLLGKEGGSGGWSHLHFDISGRQPSGKWGIVDGYAFLWEAYLTEHRPELMAVARPHHFAVTGQPVILDASRSWSASGPLAAFQWACTDGQTGEQMQLERAYEKPGVYCETLRVTDRAGRVDYDFALVHVLDSEHPDVLPPSIHATYAPTFGIRPGTPVKFLVRTFRTTDGEETWDFGDGSPTVTVQSDGNVTPLAKDGYATTVHAFEKPGVYLASVRRTDRNGYTATARVKVVVESAGGAANQ